MWLLSGRKGDLLFFNLFKITIVISKIGIKKNNNNMFREILLFKSFSMYKLVMASEKPKKFDPLSPINILAGLQLCLRKPRLDPISEVRKNRAK